MSKDDLNELKNSLIVVLLLFVMAALLLYIGCVIDYKHPKKAQQKTTTVERVYDDEQIQNNS